MYIKHIFTIVLHQLCSTLHTQTIKKSLRIWEGNTSNVMFCPILA